MKRFLHVAACVAYRVGEVLVVLPQRDDALRRVALFAAEDIEHGKRKETLGRLLERAVEHLVHLVAKPLRRRHSRNAPEQRDA